MTVLPLLTLVPLFFGATSHKPVPLPPVPVVSVIGAGATGLSASSRTPSFEMRIGLQANEVGARDVVLAIGDLRSESGSLTPVKLTDAVLAQIGPGKVAFVTLAATLTEPGSYSGVIVITHDGRSEPAVALVVTRTRTPPTVEVTGAGTAERVRWGVWDTHDSRVELTLRETAGQVIHLGQPILADLGRVDGDVTVQPDDPDVEIEQRRGRGAWARVDDGGITVPANGSVDLRFTLPAANSPGAYTATAKLAEAGGLPVDKAVKVFVRLAAWVLWGAIAVGLLLAFVVRRLLRGSRDRAILQRRLREVIVDVTSIGGSLDADANELVAAVLAAEDDLERRVDGRGADLESLTTKVAHLDVRAGLLPVWLRLHRLIDGIEPSDIVSAERAKLITVRGELMTDRTTDDRLVAIGTDLSAMEGTLATKIHAALHQVVEEVERLLDAQEPFLTPSARVRTPEVRELLELAATRLRSADYTAASVAVAGARERLLHLLIEDLREFARNLPTWVEPYRTLVGPKVVAALDQAAGPRQRYDNAQRVLVRELVTVAKKKTATLTDAQQKADVERLLQEAETKIDDDVVAARSLLESAVTRAGGFAPTARYRTAEEGRALREVIPTAGRVPARLRVPGEQPLPARRARARRDLAALSRRIRLIDRISLAVAGVVALVIGTLVLYGRDWGTLPDIATAILWGLGIQVGAGFTFQGIESLLGQLESPSQAATGRT